MVLKTPYKSLHKNVSYAVLFKMRMCCKCGERYKMCHKRKYAVGKFVVLFSFLSSVPLRKHVE